MPKSSCSPRRLVPDRLYFAVHFASDHSLRHKPTTGSLQLTANTTSVKACKDNVNTKLVLTCASTVYMHLHIAAAQLSHSPNTTPLLHFGVKPRHCRQMLKTHCPIGPIPAPWGRTACQCGRPRPNTLSRHPLHRCAPCPYKTPQSCCIIVTNGSDRMT
jgi:hypothetical protein